MNVLDGTPTKSNLNWLLPEWDKVFGVYGKRPGTVVYKPARGLYGSLSPVGGVGRWHGDAF